MSLRNAAQAPKLPPPRVSATPPAKPAKPLKPDKPAHLSPSRLASGGGAFSPQVKRQKSKNSLSVDTAEQPGLFARKKSPSGGATAPATPPRPTSLSRKVQPNVIVATSPATDKPSATTAPTVPAQNEKPKESTTHGFTLWAHNLGYCASFFLLIFGIFGILWAERGYDGNSLTQKLLLADRDMAMQLSFWVAVYATILSAPVFVFEYQFGLMRGAEPLMGDEGAMIPLRGILYICLALPCFLSYPCMMAGIVLIITGTANCIASVRGERVNQGTIRKGAYCLCSADKSPGWGKEDIDPKAPKVSKLQQLKRNLLEGSQLSQAFMVTAYVLINAGMWMQSFLWWQNTLGPDVVFAPFAKAFGQLLNFNCSLILFPVLRALLRGLNNYQISPTKSLANYLPLRKNIIFHKFIAMTVLLAVLGHVTFHYINFAEEPEVTHDKFGVLPWYTGYVIVISMVVIFSGAQARVKRAHYEIFWFSHHWFIVFFGFLLAHGPVFWIWSFVPVMLYISERVLRNSRGNKPFFLLAVRYTKPVMMLEFFPKRNEDFVFREGQYLYIMSPTLSRNEWHPFTISSAHDDMLKDPGRVTLHIRVQRPGSWTARLRDYFEQLAPPSGDPDHFEVEMSHIDADGRRQRGKFLGPDGQRLICVDGPHAAPAQHYSVYSEVMLVGAGIGLTPAAAIIQAVLRHKWKKGFHPEVIRFYWVVRHAEIESFAWFIELLTRLEGMVASDRKAGSIPPGHELEINIFVTSAPKTGVSSPTNRSRSAKGSPKSAGALRSPVGTVVQQAGFNVDIGFDTEQLTEAIMNPKTSSKNVSEILEGGVEAPAPNKLQDIYIWNGRPDWDAIFKGVKSRRKDSTTNIGVCFCGAAVIGKDLKKNCIQHSSVQDNCMFSLHKENF